MFSDKISHRLCYQNSGEVLSHTSRDVVVCNTILSSVLHFLFTMHLELY